MGRIPRFPGMKVIGLTGPSGAGKGLVASLFVIYGIPSIDTDQVYHALLIPPSPCLEALTQEFGTKILDDEGHLDRGKLSQLVFSPGQESEKRRERLNQITHAFIIRKSVDILREQAERGCKAVLLDAPLLIEAGLDRDCDAVIAVLANPEVRAARLQERDHLPSERIHARIEAQPPDSFYRAHAQYCLDNSGTPEELLPAIDHIVRSLALLPDAETISPVRAIGKS